MLCLLLISNYPIWPGWTNEDLLSRPRVRPSRKQTVGHDVAVEQWNGPLIGRRLQAP